MYIADEKRYENMNYRRIPDSGISLPAISLGLWHNFGEIDTFENQRKLITHAFDKGIVHFDLANNYGPPPGEAEKTFGRILKECMGRYRDELFISTKAGYKMWDGPYGDFGSKKYLVSSLDASLKRMGLDYVDLFYHHRMDPNTPLEETVNALASVVRQGKALYVGISSYLASETKRAYELLKNEGVKLLIHQPSYNLLNRWVEKDLLNTLSELKVGCIPFVPLAQGLLTTRYLKGIPSDSRVKKDGRFLKTKQINTSMVALANELHSFAMKRDQSITQLAIAWLLRREEISSVLIGASKTSQIDENVDAINNIEFSQSELIEIDNIITKYTTITKER